MVVSTPTSTGRSTLRIVALISNALPWPGFRQFLRAYPNVFGYFGYHRSNDLPEHIDPVQGAGVVKANLAVLADLAGVQFLTTQDINPSHLRDVV